MFKNIKKKLRIDFYKNSKIKFYMRGLWILYAPSFVYKKDLEQKFFQLDEQKKEYILDRVYYYNKIENSFAISKACIEIQDFIKKEKRKTYFFDLLEYLRYFDFKKRISYIFGDVVDVPKYPSIVKSRPINGDNKNSILMKLNKVRHFIFVDDPIEYDEKKDQAVWRGKCYKEHRQRFVQKYYNSKLCNIGQHNTKGKIDVPWQKEKLSLAEQLEYKFLVAIEGNDVASNLKWVMSSNSLVLMAKPKYETWFMEGRLIPNVHYALVDDGYENLEERIEYFIKNPNEAKKIIKNANEYIEQFLNKDYEDIISYQVLKKYFEDSRQ